MGMSDLAEIATICALEQGVSIAAVIDPKTNSDRFVGTPIVASIDAVPGGFDALVVTDLGATRETVKAVRGTLEAERVLIPALLRLRLDRTVEGVA
jgi:anti-sigma-K factor RskA